MLRLGAPDAREDELRRGLRRRERFIPAAQKSRERRGEEIARAVASPRKARMAVVTAKLPAAYHDAGRLRLVAHAGEHDRADALFMQRGGELFNIRLVIFFAVLHAGEQRRLRDIRKKDVRRERQRLHFLHERGIKPRIELSVIGHGGINDARAARHEQRVHDVPDMGDLLAAAEIAGVHRVEAEPLFLPMLRNGGHVRRQVAERIAREASAGVRGEYCRGQHRRFHAARRQNRQRHRERALAHAGDVLHR